MMHIINLPLPAKISDLVNLQTEMEMMNLMRQINKTGVAFLMVTYSLSLVQYATRAFSVENGKLFRVKN